MIPSPAALSRALRAGLPGNDAHLTMLPRSNRRRRFDPRPDARSGAVLIALVPQGDTVALPLIQRTDDGGPHARQISLPGGAAEPGDGAAEETALREAREEIGLPEDSLEVLGALSELYIEVSNFHITPVVAWYHGPDPETELWPRLSPQPEEVERIIRATIEELHQSLGDRHVHGRGYRLVVPSYLAEGEIVWGATGMILAEFLSVFQGAAQKSAGSR